MQPVNEPDFSALAQLEDRALLVVLTGNADLRSRASLGAFLEQVHAEARRLAAAEVTVDLRQLLFMNSSCFKNFISWITSMQEMTLDERYRISFISDPGMHWQKRSLHALTCFSEGLVSVRK